MLKSTFNRLASHEECSTSNDRPSTDARTNLDKADGIHGKARKGENIIGER
jgi:hypothetical protein